MKKQYLHLLTIAFLTGISLSAQETAVKKFETKAAVSAFAKVNSEPVFLQNVNPQTAIMSTKLPNGEGIFVAEDFQLSTTTAVKTFEFVGFQGEDNFLDVCTGASLYIYADNNGKPAGIPTQSGTPIYELNLERSNERMQLTKLDSDLVYSFLIDTSGFVAEANTRYWVIFTPTISEDTNLADELVFNWFFSTDSHYNDALLVDPFDLWNAGISDWISLNDTFGPLIFTDLRGLAMALYDESFLSTENMALSKEITIFPNPASEKFTVNVKELERIEIYDLSGKLISISTSNTNDISYLPKGIYTIKVNTKDGRSTIKKLIKK